MNVGQGERAWKTKENSEQEHLYLRSKLSFDLFGSAEIFGATNLGNLKVKKTLIGLGISKSPTAAHCTWEAIEVDPLYTLRQAMEKPNTLKSLRALCKYLQQAPAWRLNSTAKQGVVSTEMTMSSQQCVGFDCICDMIIAQQSSRCDLLCGHEAGGIDVGAGKGEQICLFNTQIDCFAV